MRSVLKPGINMTGLKATTLYREFGTAASASADICHERRNFIPAWVGGEAYWDVRDPGINMTGLKATILCREFGIAASASADIRYERRNFIPVRA